MDSNYKPQTFRKLPGRIKEIPEDFQVWEVPAYAPSGEGTHLLVHFRKRGLTTKEAVRSIARALGTDAKRAGVAGHKDKHAVTAQWVSFEGACRDAARGLALEGIEVLDADHHPHKIRTGHLKANSFDIVVRGEAGLAEHLRCAAGDWQAQGYPNYYGPQRMGAGEALERARLWIASGGRHRTRRQDGKWLMSVLQSELFNRWLDKRVELGIGRALPGDLFRKEDTGGLFTEADQAKCQRRMDDFEITPTGPMFGAKMRDPAGEALELEAHTLADAELTREHFKPLSKYGRGTRRPMRVRPRDVAVQAHPAGARIRFTLPSGSYATSLLHTCIDLTPDGSNT